MPVKKCAGLALAGAVWPVVHGRARLLQLHTATPRAQGRARTWLALAMMASLSTTAALPVLTRRAASTRGGALGPHALRTAPRGCCSHMHAHASDMMPLPFNEGAAALVRGAGNLQSKPR